MNRDDYRGYTWLTSGKRYGSECHAVFTAAPAEQPYLQAVDPCGWSAPREQWRPRDGGDVPCSVCIAGFGQLIPEGAAFLSRVSR